MHTMTTPASTASSLAPTELLKDELDQVNKFYDLAVDYLTTYSFQILAAFIIFIIGFIVAGKIANVVLRLCEKHRLDVTLSRFLANTSKMLIVVFITIMALGKLGISVTPFIAAIGAISLGAGLALQGLLANYAAGFNIILTRPFVVGDTIKVQNVVGIVKEVLLAYTILTDEDNVEITIPNKHIVGEILQNSQADSVLELSVGIAYHHDPIAVSELLAETIAALPMINQQRKPQVGIDDFSDSAITIAMRFWVPTCTLYATKYEAYKAVYLALKKAEITIPFPQQDVYLHSIKND